MEFIYFISTDVKHFFGFILVLIVLTICFCNAVESLGEGVANIIRAFKENECE